MQLTNPKTKPLFTRRHYERLTMYCATLLIATNGHDHARKALRIMSAMLEADNANFDPGYFEATAIRICNINTNEATE